MVRSFILLFGIAVVLSACTSSSTSPSNPNDDKTNGNNQFTVTGGGYSGGFWRGYKDESTSIAYTAAVGGTGSFVFTGLTTTADEVFTAGMITSSSTPGTYVVNPAAGNAMTLVYGSPKKTFISTSGTIQITQFDAVGGRAKGTFSGSFIDAGSGTTLLTVASGKFDLPVRDEQ